MYGDDMAVMSRRKGYLYTIEVMIMVAVIIMSISYLFRYPLAYSDTGSDIIRRQGMDALEYLGMQDMRHLVSDINELNTRIDELLPDAVESVACLDCSDIDAPAGQTIILLNYFGLMNKGLKNPTLNQ